jgi:hypothetical protein
MGELNVDVMGHPITSVRCSADGNTVLASCLDGKIRLVDRGDGAVLKAFGGGQQEGDGDGDGTGAGRNVYRNTSLRIRSMFAKGDAVVVSGSEREDAEGGRGDSQAMVFAWDVMSGDVIGTVPAGEDVKVVSCVAWNEKGKCWASGCSDGECISGTDCWQESGGSKSDLLTHRYQGRSKCSDDARSFVYRFRGPHTVKEGCVACQWVDFVLLVPIYHIYQANHK